MNKLNVNFLLSILFILTCSVGMFAQTPRDRYQATSSYDLKVSNKVTEKASGKIFSNTDVKARVYYNEKGDFVIIEQIETNEDKPLEMSIIDFENGTHIILKDKNTNKAIIKSFGGDNVPGYMKEEYNFELGEAMERDGLSVRQATYTVADLNKVDARLEITDNIKAPNYLSWMQAIQHDLNPYFPLQMELNREDKEGMLTRQKYNAINFKEKNPFNIATLELDFGEGTKAKEDRANKEIYGDVIDE